jgi:hypothetical protein
LAGELTGAVLSLTDQGQEAVLRECEVEAGSFENPGQPDERQHGAISEPGG